jgi:ADP-heptose:LPS heptosyltransferase
MYKIINRKKLLATAAADILGNIVFSPRLLFRGAREIRPEEVREILVIRTAYIGDVVMTVPILKPLKDFFKGARVSFLTSRGGGEVLRNNPWLDEIITYDPFWFYPSGKGEYFKFIKEFRKRRFDLVIEARADIREIMFLVWPLKAGVKLSYKVGGGAYLLTHTVPYPGLKHKVQYHLDIARHLGCEADGIHWGVYLAEDERARAKEILAVHNVGGRFIAAHPGARLRLKRWLTEKYAILYDRLIERYGLPLVVLGTKHERALVDKISGGMRNEPVVLAGETGLREMAGIIEEAALFLCNDSAPMHIAAAVGTPTVALFGPSNSVETGPYGDLHKVVEKDFPCRYSCDESTCRIKRFHACMRDIEVQDVLSAVRDVMGWT